MGPTGPMSPARFHDLPPTTCAAQAEEMQLIAGDATALTLAIFSFEKLQVNLDPVDVLSAMISSLPQLVIAVAGGTLVSKAAMKC